MHRIQTSRLILRPWLSTDREPFSRLNADPEVMEHFGGPLTRASSNALADRIADHIVEHGWGLWAVEAVGVADFIGFVGLNSPRFEAPFTPAVEVGWRLDRDHWGHGYATEAASAAIALGFIHLGLDEIVSFTVPANTRSRTVMERLGMTRDPSDDFDHPAVAPGDPRRRHVLYRLRRTAWLTSGRGYEQPARSMYLDHLPKKRTAAGVLFHDGHGRVLIVDPTYKAGWDIPGGAVDADESPRAACRREIHEELGIDLDPGPLLCVDYSKPAPDRPESLVFVFDGGMLDDATVRSLRLDRDELADMRFVSRSQAGEMLRHRVAARVEAVWDLMGTGRSIYLEEQGRHGPPAAGG